MCTLVRIDWMDASGGLWADAVTERELAAVLRGLLLIGGRVIRITKLEDICAASR
jgi:hypothetical protein